MGLAQYSSCSVGLADRSTKISSLNNILDIGKEDRKMLSKLQSTKKKKNDPGLGVSFLSSDLSSYMLGFGENVDTRYQ